MKITVRAVHLTTEPILKSGIMIYSDRLKHYCDFSIEELNFKTTSKKSNTIQQLTSESSLLLKNIQPTDYVVLLDEKGKQFSSEGFAKFIADKQNSSLKRLFFLIGGPYGFDKTVISRSNFQISLSAMTFTHQMVRLIFLEQLYRAYTIIKGEPYHHN